jgi:hypothetical protein
MRVSSSFASMRNSAGNMGLMKRAVVGTCAILVALFAGGEAAQSQEAAVAKVHNLVKHAIRFVKSPHWMRRVIQRTAGLRG